jgi:hypothetical protein
MGSVLPILSSVIAAITEAGQVLDAIDIAAQRHFANTPNKSLEEEYGLAMSKARLALSAAMRTAKGAEKLDQQKVDQAFADFRKAYQDVIELLGPYGIVATSQDGNYGTTGVQVVVPEPMALTLEVE